MQLRPIYTEPDNCQDCYKCIRECPVKAIRMENNQASIIEDRCIYCGHCTQVCPTGAKKIRDGLTRAKLTLTQNPKVILSLAPSYVSEFEGIHSSVLIAAIKRLGFTSVSETALGAEIVTDRTEKFLEEAENGVYISSACPVVVEYIRKYSPDHARFITPIISPMLAHAKILKQLYGEDVKIVFAGPCICKKLEADYFNNLVDVVITFKDLKKWFEQSDINLKNIAPNQPEASFRALPFRDGRLLPHRGWNAERDARGQKTNTSHGFLGTFNRERRVERTGFTPGERFHFLGIIGLQGRMHQRSCQIEPYIPGLKKIRDYSSIGIGKSQG